MVAWPVLILAYHCAMSASDCVEIRHALDEWARVVAIEWREIEFDGPNTLTFLWASGDHGDGFPFTCSCIAAHSFYPPPLVPEPLAGDVHFNRDANWAEHDLYSVSLHEIGHALGLTFHLYDQGAAMYPYYQRLERLSMLDIEAIRKLYPSRFAIEDLISRNMPRRTPGRSGEPSADGDAVIMRPSTGRGGDDQDSKGVPD